MKSFKVNRIIDQLFFYFKEKIKFKSLFHLIHYYNYFNVNITSIVLQLLFIVIQLNLNGFK